MTRSHGHKHHGNDHEVSPAEEEHLPRFFAKHGPLGANPKKLKKDGAGKANWGREGDEVDQEVYNMTNPRRRSNSSTLHNTKDFKTKFETVEPEPVFEEDIHGPIAEDVNDLEKMSTGGSSNTEGSVDEEDLAANNNNKL